MKWYSIGALTFPASWAAIAIAFVLVSLYLHFRADKNESEWYGNAVFLFLMIWKLSVIIFQFKLSITNPFNILYFHGGVKGYFLGLAAAMIYTLYRMFKFSIQWQTGILAWLLTVGIYEICLDILMRESGLFIILQFITALVFIWIVLKQTTITWHVQALILFTLIQVLFYSLKNDLLSIPIATYVIMALFLSILPNLEAKK